MSSGEAPEAVTEMPWIKWLDLDTTIDDVGTLVVTMARPKPEHVNHHGAINGAVAYGVAEVAGLGAAVIGMLDLLSSTYTVVESATIDYGVAANGGLVATSRVEPPVAKAARDAIERGQAVQLRVAVALADPAGRSTGTASFTIALRPRRSRGYLKR